MPLTPFVLKHDDRAEIEIFEERPNWLGFASKIITLFEIPPSDFAGIMYFDGKKDLITLHNDQELQHFYASPDALVFEFFVKDLRFPAVPISSSWSRDSHLSDLSRKGGCPRSLEHSSKRHRMENNELPHTPPRTTHQTQGISPRLKPEEIEPEMTRAFEPFAKYISYLANGKLDGYFDSIKPEDLVTDLKVQLPSQPMLLHHLGNQPDDERIKRLFRRDLDTVHLFAVSGSGKTRLGLEGLCLNWGFYISCGTDPQKIGSRDFHLATEFMTSMNNWDSRSPGDPDSTKSVNVANRAFTMLICARIFVLTQLLQNLPSGANGIQARKRWVLIQALPPFDEVRGDIFSAVLRSLRAADTSSMHLHTVTMLERIRRTVGNEIFPKAQFFTVVDEAQVAAEYLTNSFRSFTTGIDKRPVLHAFYTFLSKTPYIGGVILAGTGLTKKMVQTAVSSRVAIYIDKRPQPIVFVEVGRFTKDGRAYEDYIRKYLPLSTDSVSDQRLVDRILYWFSGRYRFTASLIELLLYTQSSSRHRILTDFTRALTGFTITDAIDLEEHEPPLTEEVKSMLGHYEKPNSVSRLFKESDREELINCLFDALMRWRIGSQLTSIPIEGYMHELVALGIGHLEKVGPLETLPEGKNYPVYLCEPLIILQLSSVFEEHRTRAWIIKAFRTARNASALGTVFEDAAAMMLLQMFGDKPCTLSDAFHCNQPWGSRKVTLVSLKCRIDDTMQCCPVSWNSGSSDCLGHKASSPADVLAFFNNPNGKTFLFPDNHMSPDLLFFLRDEDNGELILVGLQAKIKQSLDAQTWMSALDSVALQFFYTANTKNGKMKYAPLKYPGITEDVLSTLNSMLGPGVYRPVVEKHYHLHSYTSSGQTSPSQPLRQVPRYLHIIATPDNEHKQCLKAEQEGDVGSLQWDCETICWLNGRCCGNHITECPIKALSL